MSSRASASEPGPGTWSLGSVAGIRIGVDRSWILIFLLLTFSLGHMFGAEHVGGSRAQVWATALVSSLVFFACIVLHELGHSLVALRLGVRVRSITLFVFGGIARLESEPKRARDEVWIALAGPLVSVALGLGFYAAARVLGEVPGESLPATALGWLGRINLVLAAFNAVPGFPLDGGRVLRGAVWAATGSFARATRVAGATGAAFAWTLIAFGGASALFAGQLLGGLWLVFIGWFLLGAARAAVSQMVLEQVLDRVRVRDALEPMHGSVVDGSESVQRIIDDSLLHRGVRTHYVVGPGGELEGLLSLHELIATPRPSAARRRCARSCCRANAWWCFPRTRPAGTRCASWPRAA